MSECKNGKKTALWMNQKLAIDHQAKDLSPVSCLLSPVSCLLSPISRFPSSSLAKANLQPIVSALVMATYIYETVPDSPEVAVRRFEIKQSMKEAPLTQDPQTGQKVRRIISGGLGIMTGARSAVQAPRSSCGTGRCGCC
jgi:predicted nucleic acid-binding Zn ribbon protein